MPKFKYVIDSSVIIRRSQYQRYDMESFPQHWKTFDKKIKEGLFVSTPLVKKEINAKNKELLNWVDENDTMFETIINQKVVNEATFLSKKFPDWYNNPKNKNKPWADSQVIAFAKAHDIVLVTQEKWNSNSPVEENYRIPTICSKIGAYCQIGNLNTPNINRNTPFQCIDFIELSKRERLYE